MAVPGRAKDMNGIVQACVPLLWHFNINRQPNPNQFISTDAAATCSGEGQSQRLSQCKGVYGGAMSVLEILIELDP